MTVKALHALRDQLSAKILRSSRASLYSPWLWWVSWSSESPGFLRVAKQLDIPVFKYKTVVLVVKNILLTFFNLSPCIHPVFLQQRPQQYRTVFLSWLLKGDAANAVRGIDRYFGDLSALANALKIQICIGALDHKDRLPLANAGVVAIEWQSDWLRPLKVIYILCCDLASGVLNIRDLRLAINGRYINAWMLTRRLHLIFDKMVDPRALVYLAYEAQPEQRRWLDAVREHYKGVKVIGYVHSSLMNLPFHYLYDSCPPDLILVHGHAFPEVLRKHCGWPLTVPMKVVPSLRFTRKSATDFEGKIFLPFSIPDPELLYRTMIQFFNENRGRFTSFKVQIHPAQFPKHLQLRERLLDTFASDRTLFAQHNGETMAIFVGGGTALLEALESEITCLQICLQQELERWSADLWPALAVEDLGSGIFRYRLKQFGQFIIYESQAALTEQTIAQHRSWFRDSQ